MTKNDSPSKGVIIQILGDEYQIANEGDAVDLQRIAKYVDEKMKSLASQHAGRIPKTTLAVLAAMEITSELFSTLQEQHRLAEKAQENLARLTRLVDDRANMPSTLLGRERTPLRHLWQDTQASKDDSTPAE